MCNCHAEMTTMVTDHIKANAPAGSEQFDIEINGFVFGMADSGMTHRSSNSVKAVYMAPKKAGGMKRVSKTTYIRATYCPFCGVNYADGEAAEKASE